MQELIQKIESVHNIIAYSGILEKKIKHSCVLLHSDHPAWLFPTLSPTVGCVWVPAMTILNQIKITPPGSVKQTHSVRTFVPSFLLRFHEFEPEHFIYSAPSQRFVSKGSCLFLSSTRPLICLRKSQSAAIAEIWFKPCETETVGTINTTINTDYGLFVGSFNGCVCCCGMQ